MSDNEFSPLARKMVEAARSVQLQTLQALVDGYAFNAQCESPIERLMLVALASFSDWRRQVEISSMTELMAAAATVGDAGMTNRVSINPQVKVGPYRVDFLLVGNLVDADPLLLVVECDGHEFHEKTKQQAARDKARDRYLVSRGFTVMRFSGSEIWADAAGCASQAMELLDAEYLKSSERYLSVCKAIYKERTAKSEEVSNDPR